MTKVLLLYEVFNASTRLCAYEQLSFLEKKGIIELHHCIIDNITNEMCRMCDVVILVRISTVLGYKLTTQLKKSGKYIIYILDDDLLNISSGLISTNYYRSKPVQNRIKNIIRIADVLASPSPILLDTYASLANKTTVIEEPCINFDDQKKVNTKVKIGFAGSVDRGTDIDEILSEVIRKLLDKYRDKITIEFMGAKPKIVDELGLTYYPYTDNYQEYQTMLKGLNWDIGLAPMPDSLFHKCKHYNKYIEYSSFGIIGVYSNLIPYTQIIENQKNGILCGNSVQSWIDGISWLVDTDNSRLKMKQNIKKDIKEKFIINQVAIQYLESMPAIQSYKADKYKKINIKVLKRYSFIIRSIEYVVRNGFKKSIFFLLKKNK